MWEQMKKYLPANMAMKFHLCFTIPPSLTHQIFDIWGSKQINWPGIFVIQSNTILSFSAVLDKHGIQGTLFDVFEILSTLKMRNRDPFIWDSMEV